MFKEIFKKKKVAKNILGHPKIGTFSEKNWVFWKAPPYTYDYAAKKNIIGLFFFQKPVYTVWEKIGTRHDHLRYFILKIFYCCLVSVAVFWGNIKGSIKLNALVAPKP